MTANNINRDAQLSTIANAAYLDKPPETISIGGLTWERVLDTSSKPNTSGFFGVAYRNTQSNEIAVAYRGTNGLSDLKADTTFVSGGWSQQFTDAAKFTADVKALTTGGDERYQGAKLLTTGHSLGDGIAQIMGKMFSLDGTGFEGPGAARVVQNAQFAAVKAQYASDTTGQIGAYITYRAAGSVISGTGTHLGSVENMVNLSEGGALGFTGAAIGIVGLATGGVGGILLGALGLAGSNVASNHSMDGMERSMYVKAGLENALASGALTMSSVPQSSVTGQAWAGSGTEPQVIVFKNSNSQVAAYIQKQGDGWKLSTPDQSTSIVLTPSTGAGQAPQCVVNQAGKESYSCVLDEGAGTLTRKIDIGANGTIDQTTIKYFADNVVETQVDSNSDGKIDTETLNQYAANGDVVGSVQTSHQTNTAASTDTLASTLQTLRDQNASHDSQVLEAAEIRAIAGAQGNGESWGGGRMLDLSDSQWGDYYWRNEHSSATDAPMATDSTTHGLGLVDGFDLGNGASVWEPDSGSSDSAWYDVGSSYSNNGGYSADSSTWVDPGNGSGTYAPYVPPDNYYYDHYTNYETSNNYNTSYDYYDYFWPVVLDMDGDGIELVAQADSRAWFDVKGDGQRHNIGWVGKDDAMLVIDDNNNGKIDQAKELSMALWTADTTDTDLQALKTAFDSNRDGVFDSRDARFGDFRVWQDANGDGNTDAGELKTLVQAGIARINLSEASADLRTGGNHVAGFASYVTTSGAVKAVGDVGLGYDEQGWRASQDSSFVRMTESGGLAYGVAQSVALNLNMGASNLDGAVGSAGNDVLSAGSKAAVMLQGGAGNDGLTGGTGDDWLQGDAGADALVGGAGDDALLIDQSDLTAGRIDGGDGFDVAIVTDDQATTMNLASYNLEAVVGGAGNDNFSTSGTTRVILSGGAGNDMLTGGTASDILFGGRGNDNLAGGAGNDIYVFNRGDGRDTVTDSYSRTETYLTVELADKVKNSPEWQRYLADATAFAASKGEPVGSPTYSWLMNVFLLNSTTWQYVQKNRVVEANAGSGDVLRLGSDIALEDVQITASGADMVVGIYQNGVATSDQIVLKNWSNVNARVEGIQSADGKSYVISDVLQGTSSNETLSGTASANLLNGRAGADIMKGGAGDDTYIVDNAGDVVLESAGEGTDLVRASVSYRLGTNVENLTLTGSTAINGTGNALGNVLLGNGAANVLEGGVGNDTLDGGLGDDVYRFNVGDGADVINDAGGADALVLGAGISASSVQLALTNGRLKLSMGGGSVDMQAGAGKLLEQVQFADGTVWYARADGTGYNARSTGQLAINGQIQQGQTLTLSNTLKDPDGLGTFSYLWERSSNGVDWSAIAGATAGSLTLGQDLVGQRLRAKVAFTDGRGNPESVTSSATTSVVNMNDAPTGRVTVSGLATQGQTLTAGHTLADADGMGTISWQWLADGQAITGATGSTLVLGQAQVGKAITARASYTDGYGTAEAVSSVATAKVANVNDAPTGRVTVSGTATQGQTLTASHTLADADGMGTISWQWLADGQAITGATGSTLVLGQAQVGKAITARASYTDGYGTAEAVSSVATAKVANVNDAPTGRVTVSGTATQGQTLTASHTLADADGMGTISWQWLADGQAITGATGSTLVLGQAQVGKAITARASYTDGYGTAEAVSSVATAKVANVNDAPTGRVTVSGLATQGQTLTAGHTLADADGMGTISWQWLADGQAITGATGSTLVLGQAQVGKAITARASYTDGYGTAEAVSSVATAKVANVNDAPTGRVTVSGTATQGQTLTASHTLADADGMGTISWQWLADGQAITGATGSTLVLGQAQVGKAITARASYTDGYGTAEAVSSAATGAVVALPTGEVINSINTLTNLSVGSTYSESIGAAGDHDWYRINLQAGMTYQFDQMKQGSSTLDSYLRLRDASGNQLAYDDDSGGNYNSRLQFTATTTGTYYLDAGGYADASMGAYTISLTQTEDVLDSVNTLKNLAVGSTYSESIGAMGDHDWYRINLRAGMTYQFDQVKQGSTLDSYLRLRDASGNQLAYDDDSGGNLNSRFQFTATSTGTYYLDAGGYGNRSTGTYAIGFTQQGLSTSGDDYLAGTTGADRLAGLAGNDTYVVDNVGDVVVENANEGMDTANTSVSYTLAANVENLTLNGSAVINGTGNELANTIIGNAAANILDGGAGNDTLNGGLGADTYKFGRGYGVDTLQDYATDGSVDMLAFGGDIASSQLWFCRAGNSLEINVVGGNDKAVIQNWYLGSQYQIEQFKAGDGKTLLNTQVNALVNAMAAFAPPAAGQTTLPSNYQSALSSTLAANWK